jgi:chromosome segregation ATPase
MSDLNFINAYNEVILENFNAVMKQNFMFQTQLRFMEERLKSIPVIEEKVSQLEKECDAKQNEINSTINERNKFQTELANVQNELNQKNSIIQNTVANDGDRTRLQTALNKQASEIESFKSTIDSLKKKIDEQNKYTNQLEDMLPNSKRKKLGLEVIEEPTKDEVKKEEPAKLDNATPLTVESTGGTF